MLAIQSRDLRKLRSRRLIDDFRHMEMERVLVELRAAGAKRIPEDKRAIMGRATQELRDSGIMDNVIKVGDTLPAFALPNAHGQTVTSADLLSRGALVLTVFRGHW